MKKRLAKKTKKKFVKRFIFIGVLLLINAAALWFIYFRDHAIIKIAPSLESGLQMIKGQAIELKDLDPEIKRIMIYNGSLNIPPPCPRDTYPEDKFCRKGKSRDDTNIKFVGGKSIAIDASCEPDHCVEQCKPACETAVGEECRPLEDVFQSCLKDHPEFATTSSENLGEAQSNCMQEHSQEYEKYRCRFVLSKQDEPSYPNATPARPVSFESCKKDYDESQACLQRLKVDENNKDSIVSYYEGVNKCLKRYDKVFATSGCGTVYNKSDRRFTGAVEKIFCYVTCL